jgi:hypothetical protein
MVDGEPISPTSRMPPMDRFACLCTLLAFSGFARAGDEEFKSLFNGKDLTGWTGTKEQKEHWKVDDGVLVFDGKAGKSRLSTEKTYGDFELVFDWMPIRNTKFSAVCFRENGGGRVSGMVTLHPEGEVTVSTPPTAAINVVKAGLNAGKWNRVSVRVQGTDIRVTVDGKTAIKGYSVFQMETRGAIAIDGDAFLWTGGGPMRLRNIRIRESNAGKQHVAPHRGGS